MQVSMVFVPSHVSTNVGWFSGFFKTHQGVWVHKDRPGFLMYFKLFFMRLSHGFKILGKMFSFEFQKCYVLHISNPSMFKGGDILR
jgi:hypothetical protein